MLGENITFNQVGKFTVPLQLKPFLMSVMPATSQIFVPFRPFQSHLCQLNQRNTLLADVIDKLNRFSRYIFVDRVGFVKPLSIGDY